MNRQLRARIVLEEARALGLDVDDLVAAATGDTKPITVAAWIDEIAPTFGPSTAATYRPYWRLAARFLGDRYVSELTTADLAAVVEAAAERARTPDSTGLGWDERTPVSAHVLRHTAITRIGRIAGYPVAQAFAGHAPPTVTGRYLHATLADVATAVAVLTGEPHPLDHPSREHLRRTCSNSWR